MGDKTFLVCRKGEFDLNFGGYRMAPKCIVMADSPKKAAEVLGGYYLEEKEAVYFPKELFTLTTEDTEYHKAGTIMEYFRRSLHLLLSPEAKEGITLQIQEVPFVEK